MSGAGLWLDATQLSGFADGAPVDNFADMSGNGRDFFQHGTAIAPDFPLYLAGGINGLPSVRFAGTHAIRADAATNAVFHVGTFTVALALRWQNTGATSGILNTQAGAAHGWSIVRGNQWGALVGGSPFSSWKYVGNWAGGNAASVWLLRCRFSDGRAEMWFDNALSQAIAQQVKHDGTSTPLQLGTFYQGNFPGKADIGEVVWYPSYLTDAEKDALCAYLAAKWGTP